MPLVSLLMGTIPASVSQEETSIHIYVNCTQASPRLEGCVYLSIHFKLFVRCISNPQAVQIALRIDHPGCHAKPSALVSRGSFYIFYEVLFFFFIDIY